MRAGSGLVVFRADASLQIGTGHVMRCLTLADALRRDGALCFFVCRDLPGNLAGEIRARGFACELLPAGGTVSPADVEPALPAHAAWLGTDWQTDAREVSVVLAGRKPDWLVVDHYALDWRWEAALRPCCDRLMVIDDLADRLHDCDVLLDQTLGRTREEYAPFVPAACVVLAGAEYALLRPEFSALRTPSLARRMDFSLRHVLLAMGGVDQYNATAQVLDALRACDLPEGCHLTVVMGAQAPFLDCVRTLAADMPWPTTVRVGVTDMAQLMADCDLAIGAAGATSWERCCLGVPTLMLVLADNQRWVARALQDAGAALLVGAPDDAATRLPEMLNALLDPRALQRVSDAAKLVCDGAGVARVSRHLWSAAE